MLLKAKDKYQLKCPGCDQSFQDDGLVIDCPGCSAKGRKTILAYDSLIEPRIITENTFLKRYQNFLPGDNPYPEFPNGITTVKSKQFAKKYGFKNLYMTLTGYLPREGIFSPTCSFKELEAISVLHRIKSHNVKKILLLSSAGNTARAFAYYAAHYEQQIIMVVPTSSRSFLWLPHEEDLFHKVSKYVKILFVDYPSNYRDASGLASLIGDYYGDDLYAEGGFFNIGRSAGLGGCALNFYDILGRVPENYIQAVGSGAGVLATLRTYHSLDSHAAENLKCHLIQNSPYTPLVDAIEGAHDFSLPVYEQYIDTACSPMLTSADPAYDYAGGLRDFIMKGQKLYGYSVSSEEIFRAQYEFWKLENIQILLPAAAAVAVLMRMAEQSYLDKNSLIQLNLTGCGDNTRKEQDGYFYIPAYIPDGFSVPQALCNEKEEFGKWIDKFGDGLVTCWD